MNKAVIFRDEEKNVYLKIYLPKFKVVNFLIQPYNSETKGKEFKLSDFFNIDLSGKK